MQTTAGRPRPQSKSPLPAPPPQFLRASGLYESPDEALLREEVLGLFNALAQSWVKLVCEKKNLPTEDARAHVFTFGSYRLGVHGPGAGAEGGRDGWLLCCRYDYDAGLRAGGLAHAPGADMDTLVVGPRYVVRETDFFGSEKHCLEYLLSVRRAAGLARRAMPSY
jgi:poly(A) polymerase